MGHDISGYLKADAGHANEVARLHRAAWDDRARTIYEALDCQEHDCGCSGCGHERVFTPAEMITALARVPEGKQMDRERDFLRKCIATNGDVLIAFC